MNGKELHLGNLQPKNYFLINRCMAIEEGYCPFYAGEYRNFVLNSNNMSYGATVGASAANTVKQLNKIFKK